VSEVMLEKIANGEELESRRLPPDLRSDPEGEHERADARASVPPPRGDALVVGERRRADRRPGADIRREERGKQQPHAERSIPDEKVDAAADAPADPQPDEDQRDRIGDENGKQWRHEAVGVTSSLGGPIIVW
jgi:hypothetical protein